MISETERPRFLAMNVHTLANHFTVRVDQALCHGPVTDGPPEERPLVRVSLVLGDLIKIAQAQGYARGLLVEGKATPDAHGPAEVPEGHGLRPTPEAVRRMQEVWRLRDARFDGGPRYAPGHEPAAEGRNWPNEVDNKLAAIETALESNARERAMLKRRVEGLESTEINGEEKAALVADLESQINAAIEEAQTDVGKEIGDLIKADQAHIALLGQQAIHIQETRNRIEAMAARETELRKAIDASGIVALKTRLDALEQFVGKDLPVETDPTRDSSGRSP